MKAIKNIFLIIITVGIYFFYLIAEANKKNEQIYHEANKKGLKSN